MILSLVTNLALSQESEGKEEANNVISSAEKFWLDGKEDLAIEYYMDLLYTKKDIPDSLRFRIYRNLSEHLYDLGAYDEALVYRNRSKKYVSSRKDSSFVSSYNMAHFYMGTKQLDSAICYLKLALSEIPKNESLEEKWNWLMAINNIGYLNFLNDNLDSAQYYYELGLKEENIEKDYPGLYGLISGNIGMLFFRKGEYSKSLEMAKIDIELNRDRITTSYYNALINAGRCYYKLNDYQSAKKIIAEIFAQTNIEIDVQIHARSLMAAIQKKLGNFRKSTEHLEICVILSDSMALSNENREQITRHYAKTRIQLIEQNLKLSRNKEELLATKEATAKFKLRIWMFIAICVTILLSFGFYYHRLNQKRKLILHQVQNELLQSELNNKRKDLTNFAVNLSQKRKLIEKILEKIKELKSKSQGELQSDILNLIREVNNYNLIDNSLKSLQSNINKVNSAFFEKLSMKYPSLTKTEREVCSLLMLSFTSKDIAQIRNVTPNAVKKMRQNIRKKISIEPTEDLQEYLRNNF